MSLVPLTYSPLPLGAVTPTVGSWLQSELNVSANALAGHQYDFYSYVAQSSWLGHNSEYSDLNEGLPYWFNGIVPMAYTLGDARLKSQVATAADYVLSHQSADGWLGPEDTAHRLFWARFPLLLGLTNLADADSTWTDRVVTSFHRFNVLMNQMLHNGSQGYIYSSGSAINQGDYVWGRIRYQDMMVSLMWLMEKHPQNATSMIMDNLQMLQHGAIKWEDYWVDGVFIKQSLYEVGDNVVQNQYAYTHGVNVAQGLKSAAVTRRFTHNDSLIQTQFNGLDWTWKYHGSSSGTVIADEILDGLEPFAGSELCGVVESIYSLSYVYQALGRGAEADQAELATYNALPVMVTSDWWARQYLAQTNQPLAINYGDDHNPFRDDGPYSGVFGLEPNYPCCTVNHPQGLPKFVMNSFVTNGANGLVHALLGPTTAAANLSSGSVKVLCTSSYPFGVKLSYTVTAQAPFDFYVRKPSWAQTVTFSNTAPKSSANASSGLIKLSMPAGTTKFDYTPIATIRTVPRANDTVAVYRGTLLYALAISAQDAPGPPTHYNADTSPLAPGSYPTSVADHQYTNTSAWNFAIDASTLQFHSSGSLKSPLFQTNGTGNSITAMGCQIAWPLWKGKTAGPAPPKSQRKCLGPKSQVVLVPYGSSKLHMAELPTI